MDASARLKRSSDFELEVLGNDLLLYFPETETIVALNQTGALIWNLCNGKNSIADIVRSLSDAYPDAKESIPGQVEMVIRTLLEKHALENVPVNPGEKGEPFSEKTA